MATNTKIRRCAVYTRKSSEEGLEQEFNSLDAQREAGAAFVRSQLGEGWRLVETNYDDGGISGGTLERPALRRLLADIEAGRIQVVVVYKVDRLTRSLADFAKLIEVFERHGVSFVSVTQQFNTTTSMGRLMLNVLLSFAQFEREVTGERIRDKIAASKRKGMWMGGVPPVGYRAEGRKLVVVREDAELVRRIYRRYIDLGSITLLARELSGQGRRTRVFTSAAGKRFGQRPFSRGHLHRILTNRMYRGEIVHHGSIYPGEHAAIVEEPLWEQVQRLIEENRNGTKGAVSSPRALLAGKVFDDAGNRMTAMVARKGSRRYRYYVSRALAEGARERAGGVPRVRAQELEAAVARAVDERLAGAAKDRRCPDAGEILSEDAGARLDAVRRVSVLPGRLRIELATECEEQGEEGADLSADAADVDSGSRSLEVPFRTVARRGSVRVLADPAAAGPDAACSEPLIRAVTRGHVWARRLMDGQARSLAEIAREEGVTARYVSRLVGYAFLAPDILEAILAGKQPPGLSVEAMRDPIPVRWVTQRQKFGFEAAPGMAAEPRRRRAVG